MEMKTSSLIILAFVLSILASVLLKVSDVGKQHFSQINSYQECVAAGNPVMESYPTQCKTADGRTFVNPDQHVDSPSQPSQPTQGLPYVQAGCAVTGCSREICAKEADASGVASSCIYLPQFACYKTARCEIQPTGDCGWTETDELKSCIAAAMKGVQPMSN